jgi:hypothetical protein
VAGPSNGLFYTDFRKQRRPSESFNFGRNFKLGRDDRPVTLSVRAEFANIFNRTYMADPSTSGPQNPIASTRPLTGGFGVIPAVFTTGAVPSAASQLPRTGTIVARIQF